MDYSWSIRIAGESIRFVPGARVYGAMPWTLESAAATQRRRWEFGRRQTRRKFFRPLLSSRVIGVREKLASILELTIPSAGWLVISYVLVMSLNAAALASAWFGEASALRWSLLASSVFITTALGIYAVSPFLVLRLPWKYAVWTVCFPVFLGWKLLVIGKGPPEEWVRTAREPRVHRKSDTVRNEHALGASCGCPRPAGSTGLDAPTP